MTATERIRELLDERGVEWSDVDTRTGEPSDYVTDWNVPGHGWAVGREIGGHISYTWVMGERFTPEQAIAATLGRGTCRNTQEDFDFMCSECGKCVDNGRVLGFNYCPKCGREIEA